MSCDYCWPGNCCGGPNCLSPRESAEASRAPPASGVAQMRWADDVCWLGGLYVGCVMVWKNNKLGKPPWRGWAMVKEEDGSEVGWFDTKPDAMAGVENAVRVALARAPEQTRGFFAGLTEEQQALALAYTGDEESFGEPEFLLSGKTATRAPDESGGGLPGAPATAQSPGASSAPDAAQREARLREALFSDPVKQPDGTFVCSAADDNLEGALIDLERQGADKVCINTIRRVLGQLCEARAALAIEDRQP